MRIILSFLILSISLSGCGHKFKINYDLKAGSPIQIQKKVKVALVLGGGGAKCIAQLGVIQVLEENNIPIDLIIGTSGGSIAGALYADHPHAAELKKKLFNFKQADLMSFSLLSAIHGTYSTRDSIINGTNGEKFLNDNMEAKTFDQLKIPFIAIATDIVTGKTVALNSGSIPPAVRASYSIPGLFAPVKLYGKTLVDGGVTAPLGIETAKEYDPEIIIAIDVGRPIENSEVSNMLALTYKSLNITYNTLNALIAKEADILIQPKVGTAGLFDDHKREEFYQAGVDAAKKALPSIKRMLKEQARKRK